MRKRKKSSSKSHFEERFYRNWKQRFPYLPEPTRQLKFHPVRKWRFDFAWPNLKIAVEIHGGAFMRKGGHNTGMGMSKDFEKQREATVLGWRVLPFNTHDMQKHRGKPVTRGKSKGKIIRKTNMMDCIKYVGRFIKKELKNEPRRL